MAEPLVERVEERALVQVVVVGMGPGQGGGDICGDQATGSEENGQNKATHGAKF